MNGQSLGNRCFVNGFHGGCLIRGGNCITLHEHLGYTGCWWGSCCLSSLLLLCCVVFWLYSNISVVISCIYERNRSTQRKHNHLQECMTYHWIINMRNTVGDTRETGTTYPSKPFGAPIYRIVPYRNFRCTHIFNQILLCLILSFPVVA
jgi:hypothetical protein